MSGGYLPVDDDDDDGDNFDKSAVHGDHRDEGSDAGRGGDSDGDGDGDGDRDGDFVDGLSDNNNNQDPFYRRNSIRFNRDYYGLSSRIADFAVHGGDHLLDHGKTVCQIANAYLYIYFLLA